jgi:excisionase family DNA binding protein
MDIPLQSPFKKRLAYSISEAARLLSLSRSTLYQAMAAGKLKFVKFGGRRLILEADLTAFLTSLQSREFE